MSTDPASGHKRRSDERTDPPAQRRATPSAQRRVEASAAAEAPDLDAKVDARIAMQLNMFEARLREMEAKSNAALQHKDQELNAANRVHDQLRREVVEAASTANSEAVAAKRHEQDAASARNFLAQAQMAHSAHLADELRASRDAAAVTAKNLETEAERRHAEAMSRLEADAQHFHEETVQRYRSELDAATARPVVDPAGIQQPCPVCPIKQAAVDTLQAQLADSEASRQTAAQERDDARLAASAKQEELQALGRQLADASLAASANNDELQALRKQLGEERSGASAQLAELRSKLDAATSAASAERDDLRRQLDAQQSAFQRQLADAKEQHGIREEELSNHAGGLARELEQVKVQLADRPSTPEGHAILELRLQHADSIIEGLRSQLATMERLAGNASAQNTLLIKQAAGSTTRSNCASQRSQSEHHYMGDDEDEGEDYDDDDYFPEGIPIYTAAHTQTIPPATTTAVTGAASAGGGGGGNGRPPRAPSDGTAGNGDGSVAGSANRRNDKRRTPNNGGGGGGGGNDPSGGGNGDGDGNGNAGRGNRRRARDDNASQSEVERVSRKKEGDEVKISSLPKHAHEFQAWLDNVLDAVTACASDGRLAFAWIAKLLQDSTTFEELGNIPPQHQSLDDKIRAAMSKHMAGHVAESNKELVSALQKRRDELRKPASPAAMPVQITGVQLILLVRQFFRIHDGERVQYELSTLMDLAYPGDAKLGWFKDKWDYMVRNCVTPLSDRDKQGILVKKLKGSERLRPHLQYLERIPEDHPDHCYDWVSRLIDKLVADDRKRRNTESLVLDASGKEQRPDKQPKQPGAPGKRQQQGGDANPTHTPGAPAVSGGNDQAGKGKGKGKGKDGKGKKRGNANDSDGGDTNHSGSEAGWQQAKTKKKTAEYDGKEISEVPEADRCCAHYLWVRKDGWSLCRNFAKGRQCPNGKHVTNPSKAMTETKVYARLVAENGRANVPANGPKKSDKKD